MIRPLVTRKKLQKERPEHRADANEFRRACFAAWGYECYFFMDADCQKRATDPGHIIPRSALGPKTRYCCGKENARPLCRYCHDKRKPFPLRVRRAAAKAINRYVDRRGYGEHCKVRVP